MLNSANWRQPVAASSNTRTRPFGNRQKVWLGEARYGRAAALHRAATFVIGTEQLPTYRMDECSWPADGVSLKIPSSLAFISQPVTIYYKFPGFHSRVAQMIILGVFARCRMIGLDISDKHTVSIFCYISEPK